MQHTVKSLRQAGYKVRVLHSRFVTGGSLIPMCEAKFIARMEFEFDEKVAIMPKGGVTCVQIKTPSGQELEGKAVCSSKETFNKKLGTLIALNRAFAKLVDKV